MSHFNYKCGSYDTSNYPIIKAKIHPRKPSSNDVKDYLEGLIKILKNTSGTFALYIDATESKWLGKEERDITYVGMKYIQEEFRERYNAHYILVDRILIRILIRLIFGFAKKRIVQKIFSDNEKALKEIEEDIKNWSSPATN